MYCMPHVDSWRLSELTESSHNIVSVDVTKRPLPLSFMSLCGVCDVLVVEQCLKQSLPSPAMQGDPVPPGKSPPDYLGEQWELLPGPRSDTAPPGKKIGDVEQDAKAVYSKVGRWRWMCT